MAERGEGAASLGGSYTRNIISNNSNTKQNKLPLTSKKDCVGLGEGLEGTSTPLPLRKRKYSPLDNSKRSDCHTSCITSQTTPTKRRRIASTSKENLQVSGGSSEERSSEGRLRSRVSQSTASSLAAQAPGTPSRGHGSTASPPTQRSSTRVSVSPGFYTDIEQQFRVAEWERAWSRSTEKTRTTSEETERSPGGSILKSYPLRNRLRLSEGGQADSPPKSSGSNASLNTGQRAPPPVPTDQAVRPQCPTSSQQSQSLPSSPSTPGVAFLTDTLRRLRDSRSSLHDHANVGRRSGQAKDSARSSGSWKRGRKSPSSKRGGRGKSNNTGSCASSSQHSSRCTKVGGLVTGAGMSGGSQSSNTSQSTPCGPSAPSIPPSSADIAAIMTSTSAASATLLAPSSMASLGAIGGSSSAGSSSAGPASLGAPSTLAGFMGGPTDSESDENDMGRLEALLASRGLSSSLFGALGPRMQHILHRSVSSSISSRAQQLLAGLQATGDESEQLQAVIEMCQLLVMGNEDTLAGFPVKQVTPALINLLNMEHNFDMMNHACRALTYMMEALPRSSTVVVDAVPVFLEKLQVIQCMDVAEQSLTALEMLSRKHSKAILQAHGVSACLTYIDFFSSGAQRSALSITANCCQNLTADEFHLIADSLSLLSSRITTQGEKKCVESVCLAYSRLVDCFQNDPNRLQEIAGHNLLSNIQQLLVMSPQVLNSSTFIMVIRMMSLMCSNSPELAVTLLKNNIASTLCYLLTNSTEPPLDPVELVSRSPQELYEITCLIGELMPSLPQDGIFSIDSAIQRPAHPMQDTLCCLLQDDRSNWHYYSPAEPTVIQINDTNGTVRAFPHRLLPTSSPNVAPAPVLPQVKDPRSVCLEGNSDLASSLIKSLFSLLYEVYSSSAGPAVRYKCLRALLRMVHFSSPDLLDQVLKSQAVSSHLATMLSSFDLKIIVGALQMADLLMTKLPDVFAIYFRREGVMHQIKRLSDPENPIGASSTPSKQPLLDMSSGISPTSASPLLPGTPINGSFLDTTPSSTSMSSSFHEEEKLSSPSQNRLSDVLLKRKRPKPAKINSGWRRTRQDDNTASTISEFLMKNTGMSNTRENWRMNSRNKTVGSSNTSSTTGGGSRAAASFLANLNPVRWGRCNSSTPNHDLHPSPSSKDRSSDKLLMNVSSNSSMSSSSCNSSMNQSHNTNRDLIKTWIRQQAQTLYERHFSTELQGATHPALTVLNRLISAIHHLEQQPSASIASLLEISQVVSESDISPFEVIHSGLVRSLLSYLTTTDSPVGVHDMDTPMSTIVKVRRENRIRNFLHVFLGCSVDPLSTAGYDHSKVSLLSALINKLNGCVNQLEQFPVKVHDLPGSVLPGSGRGGTSAIKFFNTHQLKCNLQRHPDSTRLKQWKGGPVKVDPLALVQAIERYLVIRGYGRLRDDDDDNSDDDNSDDDIDDTLAAVSVNQNSSSHKLQFMIGDHVLPYNMTVYQAIRQYSSNDPSSSENDIESEIPVSHSSIWLQTHTIYYRPLQDDEHAAPSCSRSGRKGKSASFKPSPKKKHDIVSDSNVIGGNKIVLESQLNPILPSSVNVRDPSIEVLALLRILYALNRHYGLLYAPGLYKPPIPLSEFCNSKLTAKANRQLQDPLVIMTGNLPQWLPQIAYACPFLFPFETRQLLFYAVSFDRDRALQRLIDSAPELNPTDTNERVTPRLERKKRTVSRDDILKQAETVINDLASSRAMLEIQYDDEVGTGLGPTLEFYALVSKELHKADLELWRGEAVIVMEGKKDQLSKPVKYVNSGFGLYPLPLARNTKVAYISKLKSKFKFIGKLMAKAVMDSRMLDLGMHKCVYKWLLGEEKSMGLADVAALDPDVGRVLEKLHQMVLQKKKVHEEAKGETITSSELQERLEKLTIDGCSVEDLSLTFTLPGYANIDLKKGGGDLAVTVNNIEQYLQLVVDWYLREGVWRQMEALKEGFESVFPIAQLHIFYPEELDQLFCGANEMNTWDMKQLAECCRPDHGYNHESKAVKFLFDILGSYTTTQRRNFLQFVTGSPRLPVGGLRSLTPPLTIVRKTFETGENPDEYLPSVMTCVNYLKLPDYSSVEVMRNKLDMAAREGQGSFHLS